MHLAYIDFNDKNKKRIKIDDGRRRRWPIKAGRSRNYSIEVDADDINYVPNS